MSTPVRSPENHSIPYEYELVLGSLLMALGVTLPLLFHLLGLGSFFMPMFYPIVLGAFLLRLKVSASIALLTPLVSYMFLAMPPVYPPVLPVMIVELELMCLTIHLFYRRLRWPLLLVLAMAFAVERAALFVLVLAMAHWLELPQQLVSVAWVTQSMPGVLLHFPVIPAAVKLIRPRLEFLGRVA